MFLEDTPFEDTVHSARLPRFPESPTTASAYGDNLLGIGTEADLPQWENARPVRI